jgi:lysophospholipase L1-like esterase
MVRVALAAGPVTFANYDYSPWATASGFNNGRFLYTFRYTGNAARPDNASSFTGGAFAYPLVMGYEAQIAKPAFTFLLSGDSITEQAVNGSGGNFGNGWNWMAVSALRAANPGLAIGYTNTGISSSDTASFFTRLKKVVAAGYNYDALVYSPFSPNDPTPSASTINLMQQRLNGALGVSATTGKPTILWTGIPNDAQNWDATADGFRLSFNAGVLGYASAVPVINMEPVISNGATPARIKSGLTTDGTHPNEAGHAAMATQAVPVMQSVITSVVGTQLNSVDLRDLPPTPANDNAAERMAA